MHKKLLTFQKKKYTTRAKKNYAIKMVRMKKIAGMKKKKHSKNWIWKNPKLIYLHLSNSTLADMHVQIILNKILIVLNANWKQTTDCVVWHNQLNWISRGDIYHRDIYSTVQNSTVRYILFFIIVWPANLISLLWWAICIVYISWRLELLKKKERTE